MMMMMMVMIMVMMMTINDDDDDGNGDDIFEVGRGKSENKIFILISLLQWTTRLDWLKRRIK